MIVFEREQLSADVRWLLLESFVQFSESKRDFDPQDSCFIILTFFFFLIIYILFKVCK